MTKMCVCQFQSAIKVSQVCLGSLLAYFVGKAKAEPKILRLVTGFRILTDLKDKIFYQISLEAYKK